MKRQTNRYRTNQMCHWSSFLGPAVLLQAPKRAQERERVQDPSPSAFKLRHRQTRPHSRVCCPKTYWLKGLKSHHSKRREHHKNPETASLSVSSVWFISSKICKGEKVRWEKRKQVQAQHKPPSVSTPPSESTSPWSWQFSLESHSVSVENQCEFLPFSKLMAETGQSCHLSCRLTPGGSHSGYYWFSVSQDLDSLARQAPGQVYKAVPRLG